MATRRPRPKQDRSTSASREGLVRGRVLRSQSGRYLVETEDGLLKCQMRGRLRREMQQSDLAVIGDWVWVSKKDRQVEEVEPRRTVFSRMRPGTGKPHESVVVANLDQVICVFACSRPAMNPRLLDRFLIIAEHNEVEAVIVGNKMDEANGEVRAVFEAYRELGYPVFMTCAVSGEGVDALRDRLAGRVSAFIGPSGVGKSSLLNAIDPSFQAAVGGVSETLDKGRHTTRVAELHHLGDAGYLADTPGIRELEAWAIPEHELGACFVEFRPHLPLCGFKRCSHSHEPNCAVIAAVEEGKISADRYDSYLRQLRGEER